MAGARAAETVYGHDAYVNTVRESEQWEVEDAAHPLRKGKAAQ
jgi:hypothetical protein